MNNLPRSVLPAWVPAVWWLAVIAWESTTYASAAQTSRFIIPLLRFLLPGLSYPQLHFLHGLLRKCGHFFGYAMLSFFMCRAWWATLSRREVSLRAMLAEWDWRTVLLALACSIAVAALDEWHQTMIPGRTGSVSDVVLDSSAVIWMQLLLITFSKKGQLALPRNQDNRIG